MQPAADDCFALAPGLLPIADALGHLRAAATPVVGTETVPLIDAAGRILAAPLVSPRDVPAFDNVAVDGWAFAHASLVPDAPTRLRIAQGRAAAGHPFEGMVPPGYALKALTGALLPDGTDTVAMWEECSVEGATVLVPAGYKPGAGRRRAGEDVRHGQRLFDAGLTLLPQHIGVAAELGMAELPIFRRLRVAVLSSGDEVIEPGAPFRRGAVYDANRPILKALLRRLPVTVTDLGILRDDPGLIRDTLARAGAEHDAILTTGGASRGDEDHVVRSVQELGSLHFWQIAMKPGRPLAFGRIDACTFIGLPGNPVATLVCALRFARPLLLGLAGGAWPEPPAYPVPAAFTLKKKPGRAELLRARLVRDETGRLVAERITREGSGILTSLTDADGLVEIAAETTRVAPGEPVAYLPFAGFGLG